MGPLCSASQGSSAASLWSSARQGRRRAGGGRGGSGVRGRAPLRAGSGSWQHCSGAAGRRCSGAAGRRSTGAAGRRSTGAAGRRSTGAAGRRCCRRRRTRVQREGQLVLWGEGAAAQAQPAERAGAAGRHHHRAVGLRLRHRQVRHGALVHQRPIVARLRGVHLAVLAGQLDVAHHHAVRLRRGGGGGGGWPGRSRAGRRSRRRRPRARRGGAPARPPPTAPSRPAWTRRHPHGCPSCRWAASAAAAPGRPRSCGCWPAWQRTARPPP
jgi:hypothetical protein